MTAGPGLPANAETLFQAVAAAADALYVVDAAGCITFLNPAVLKILGYRDAGELLGRPTHYLRPDGSRFPAAQCPLLRPSRTGETAQLEQESLVRKHSTQVAVSYSSAAVDLSSGRGAVVAFRDIVAAAMRLESARSLIGTAPADAGRLVDAAHGDLIEAITGLRRLAHGIHPAELSRHGLVAALRELARRSAIPSPVGGPTIVTADIPDDGHQATRR